MNKPITILSLVMAMLTLSACMSSGTTYKIDKVWADKQFFHVLYAKKYMAEVATPLNIHGSVIADADKHYHLKLEKNSLANGDVVDLARGSTVSGRLIYIDSDFEVKSSFFQSSDAKNRKIIITNQSDQVAIYCDTAVWNPKDLPFRLDDGLIYCGHIFSVQGRKMLYFPDVLQNKIIIQAKKAGAGWNTPRSAFALNDTELDLVFWDNIDARVDKQNPGYMEYLAIDLATLAIKREGVLPFARNTLNYLGRRGYFKHGLIVESSLDHRQHPNQIQVCEIEKCKTYDLEKLGISTASSVFFVDDSGEAITILTNTTDYSVNALYKVTILNANDLKALEIVSQNKNDELKKR